MGRSCIRFLIVVACIVAFTTSAIADDWPQWRGPNRDGVWREDGIVERFDSDRLKLRWSVPIGSGYSGPTVADGKVYCMDRMTKPKEIERVLCFDAQTGKNIWTHAYDCVYGGLGGYQAGPRASVTIQDGRAYSLGAEANFFCLDAATGRVNWSHDLKQEYKPSFPIPWWGSSTSPLVEGDLVILQVGGEGSCVVAFDRYSGKEVWRALDDLPSYSAPIVIDQAGKRVVVCWTGDSVAGLDALTGAVYWRHPFPPRKVVLAVASPVVDRDRIFVTAFYDGSLMLKLDQQTTAVEELWRRSGRSERSTVALHSIISTPVLDGDYIYGVDSYGELRCLEARTGDRLWESDKAVPPDRWSTIHFVRHGDRIWMFNERGELIISKLSPQGFEEISRAKLIEPTTGQLAQRGGVCWSHPAFANRHVFARNDEELVCASLEASAGK